MNTSASPPKIAGRILLVDVRASFTDGIWVAGVPQGTNGNPAFNMQAILPRNHPQLPALSEMIVAAAQKQWKGEVPNPNGNGQMVPAWQLVLQAAQNAQKIFLKSGDSLTSKGKSRGEGYAGNLFISTRVEQSRGRPKVYDGMLNGKPKEVFKREDSRIYSGCYVNLLIDVFPYIKGSNGVAAGFKAVQFLRDGDPIGGSAPAQADEMASVVEESAQATAEFGALFGVAGPTGNAGFQV